MRRSRVSPHALSIKPRSRWLFSLKMDHSSCIFCQIIRRKQPAEVLYENERILSFLDIRPIHFGHALVIPKNHYPDFLSLPETHFHDLLRGAQIISRALHKSLKLEGFNFFSNNGVIAGQSVFHFHLHVTPRYKDDNIKFVLDLKEYEPDGLKYYADLIRSHISLANE